jgi:hypothetical protein
MNPSALALACASLLLLAAAASAAGQEIAVAGGTIEVQFAKPPAPELQKLALGWIENCAKAVANYYGKFPVRRAVLRVTEIDGREPKRGQTSGWYGNKITISLGRAATAQELIDDWLLTHEMLHLGFPNVADRHHWIEEGLASYVEPIARARIGLTTPLRVWSDLVEGLPQGQPAAGDRGLDNTHTWGRTYWGGALFALRADVEIRRRTGNQRGLEHALRAIVEAGGTIENTWKMERVISVGDAATGVPVLRELYDEMKDQPVTVDLAALWKQLGVVPRGRSVLFDDSAPLAAVRKAITGG